MDRRSSVCGDFVPVKTVVGLERFEVGKARNSYDVPFRSCLGNSWCRAVNSIPKAKLCLNVSRIAQFIRAVNFTIIWKKIPWSYQLASVESKVLCA